MKPLLAVAFGLAAAGCGSSGGANAVVGGCSIAISAPADGTAVSIVPSTYVPVTFAVTGFTLAAPGACGHVDDGCGHIHVLVDDNTCNAPGQNFNNAFPTAGSATSPATAIAQLGSCPTVAGPHIIRLELHRDDHSAVSNGAAATVAITAGDGGTPLDGGPTDAKTTDGEFTDTGAGTD